MERRLNSPLNPLYADTGFPVVGVHWFTPGGLPIIPGSLSSVFDQLENPPEFCIGVVVLEDETTHERKGWIGIGAGKEEKADIRRICEWGSPIEPRIINEIVSNLGLSKTDADELAENLKGKDAEIARLKSLLAEAVNIAADINNTLKKALDG